MSSAASAVARWIAPFLTVAAVACLGLVADPAHVRPTLRLAADEANPLAGAPFYVNPTSAAMRAAQKADPPSRELTAIANTPQAYWIVPGSWQPRSRSTSVTRRLPAPCRSWHSMESLTATAAASPREGSRRPQTTAPGL